MAISLFQDEFNALWQTADCSVGDRISLLRQCPQHLGRGYERLIRLQNIELLIVNEQFHQDVLIETSPFKTVDCVEFGFNLLDIKNNIQESFLQWTTAGEVWDAEVYPITAGEQSLRIDIHLHPDYLRALLSGDRRSFEPELQQLLDGSSQDFFWEDCPLTPAMGVALDQILHCPFSGVTEHIYLEAKCLELIALKLDQLSQGKVYEKKSSPPSYQGFKPEDIERIDQARKRLIRDLKHPPSLSALAHQVGLNDFKLRQGFRQLYDTTVFGYLHHCRMLQAQQLLAQQHLSIGEVAQTVGYASRSAFYVAFKRKFGVSPSNYLG